MSLARFTGAACVLALALACTGPGRFVWLDEYAGDDSGGVYKIEPGDTLSIKVLGQDALSGKVKVRDDGKISMTFLNDVTAAGYAPAALAQQLQTRLKDYINVPTVSIAVDEMRALQVSVVGEVGRPGNYVLEHEAGLLQALASAGGLTDFAHRDRLFVLRGNAGAADKPETTRLRFTWQQLVRAEGRAATFRLQPGDVVVVE